ncbi:MAG: hypothetical protein H0T78_10420 [Longispora sp.]|nr:hypothetical protein [Longispora sp. (in: high G+C Gram-positive bacteria)]
MLDRYNREEWDLLVGLPRSVVIAATSVESDGQRRTVREGIAGHESIQAGKKDESPLIRAICEDLVLDDLDPDRDDILVAEEFNDLEAGLTDVLNQARQASQVLAAKARPEDATAYRVWLSKIAANVADAARSGSFVNLGGERVSASEQQFIKHLDDALA